MAKSQKDIEEEVRQIAEITEDALRNISANIKDIFQQALSQGNTFSKDIAADINRNIKSISKTAEQFESNLSKLNKGQLSYNDVQKQIEQRSIKLKALALQMKIAEENRTPGLKKIKKEYDKAVEYNNLIVESLQEQARAAEEIEKKLGSTGKLLKGISKIPVLGNLIDAEKALAAAQEAAAKEGSNRAKVIQAAAGSLFKSLKTNLFSLESVITFVVSGLFKGSQAIADFRKQTGMTYSSAYKLRAEMSAIALLSGENYITSEKLAQAYSSMTQQLGMAADVLGGDALVSATNLEQRLGMSAQDTATLVGNSRLQSKNTEDILDNSIKTVGAFNKQNKTAFNVKEILKESVTASKGLQATLGFSTEKLVKAAAEAKRLGLNLSEVENIANSLLNFESSIQSELEAELLTGRDINLEKERLLALNGDIEGLSKSLADNAAVQNAFEGKNVLQQEALAKAVGMTRDQLAKVALQQKFNNLSAEEFKERYGETTYESLKSASAAEKFQTALAKITSILGDILALFTPILDVIAYITSHGALLALTLGTIAILHLPKIGKSIKSAYEDMKGLVSSSIDFLKNLKKSGTGGIADTVAGGAADKTKDLAGKVGENTKGLTKEAGAGIKSFFTNLGQGIKAFGEAIQSLGPKGLAYAAAGLALLTGSLIGIGFALKLAAPGFEALGKAIKSVLEGVGTIITSVADGFVKLMGAITLEGVASIAALGPALMSLGAGLSFMGGSLLLGGGAAILALTGLAMMSSPMVTLANSIGLLATNLKLLNTELKNLDSDKLDTLSDFASDTAGPMSVVAGGIKNLVGGGENKELAEIRDILNQILTKTGAVYIDSNKIGTTQLMGTYRTQ